MAEFRMPALGAEMDAGTIVEWRVKPGDHVKRGDIVALVDTDKAAIEVECFETGLIERIDVPEGQRVPVGTPLAFIRADGEASTAPAAVAAPAPTAAPSPATRPTPAPAAVPGTQVPSPPPVKPRPTPTIAAPRIHVSPLAARIAKDLGVDLATVKGTGLGGAITKADVERAASPPAAVPAIAPAAAAAVSVAPAQDRVLQGSDRQAAMRKAIAAAMSRSKREIPHYYLGITINMARALAWLQEKNLVRPITERTLYAVLLLKATALAAREVPDVNGFWFDNGFQRAQAVHVGVAIALRQGGLIAPAIHDVDKKSLDDIMVDLRDLVRRVRAGTLRSSEIADATITVSNLGEQGVESVFGVIYPPQVALVGFGRIVDRPWAEGGMLGVKPVMAASLAGDHRASDGHRGGLFLAAIDRHLQEPEKL